MKLTTYTSKKKTSIYKLEACSREGEAKIDVCGDKTRRKKRLRKYRAQGIQRILKGILLFHFDGPRSDAGD